MSQESSGPIHTFTLKQLNAMRESQTTLAALRAATQSLVPKIGEDDLRHDLGMSELGHGTFRLENGAEILKIILQADLSPVDVNHVFELRDPQLPPAYQTLDVRYGGQVTKRGAAKPSLMTKNAVYEIIGGNPQLDRNVVIVREQREIIKDFMTPDADTKKIIEQQLTQLVEAGELEPTVLDQPFAEFAGEEVIYIEGAYRQVGRRHVVLGPAVRELTDLIFLTQTSGTLED